MANDKLVDFARRLAAVRHAYAALVGEPKLTNTKFAKRLGIEGEAYRRYERGETEPKMATLQRIREVTGISLDFLIAGADAGIGDPSMMAVECMATFAERLVWSRELKKLSMRDAAHLLGTSVAQLHRWETGRDAMTMDTMEKAAEVFSVTLDFLVRGLPIGLNNAALAQLRLQYPSAWKTHDTSIGRSPSGDKVRAGKGHKPPPPPALKRRRPARRLQT